MPTGHNLAMTTTFTAPPQCTPARYTSLAATPGVLFNNAVIEADADYRTCLSSQFYTSVVAQRSLSLQPFSPLICPYGWESWDYQDHAYRVCCPQNFAPEGLDMEASRPAEGAWCTSMAYMEGMLMDVTSYDTTGGTTFLPLTISANDAYLVYANAFDGYPAASPTPTASA
ncbi:CFEM domain protein [Apiospora phragmitis]|uniref:CFEM domain protein n=1 Tax=Apiospora phragmitis TaxID=2905665 RepID=A0ABR1VK26_9PEZI